MFVSDIEYSCQQHRRILRVCGDVKVTIYGGHYYLCNYNSYKTAIYPSSKHTTIHFLSRQVEGTGCTKITRLIEARHGNMLWPTKHGLYLLCHNNRVLEHFLMSKKTQHGDANNLPVRQASQHECLACNKDPPMKWGVIQRKCRQAGPCRVEHLNNICSGDQRLNSNCSPSEFIQAAYSR